MADISSPSSITIGKLSKIDKEFEEKFKDGTEYPDCFLTLTKIEKLWGNGFRSSAKAVYCFFRNYIKITLLLFVEYVILRNFFAISPIKWEDLLVGQTSENK